MTTTEPAANTAVQSILAPCRVCTSYGELLVKDIPADQFAHMPHPAMNHPAFCIGHLSLYPNRMLHLLGRSDRVEERAGYEELFAAGVECVNEAEKYPGKDELVAFYLDRHRAIADALEEATDEVLARENPAEGQFRQMAPTIGAALNFILCAHHMTHLGQISAWRRAAGLPGVF